MRLHWQSSIDVQAPIDQVYVYLSDFSRHREWARSIERMETVRSGDAHGVGARYITHERHAFTSRNGKTQNDSTMKTVCDVLELVPNQRITWRAHPVPKIGSARLCFTLTTTADGGTRITQTIDEYYPAPIALLMRVAWNITEDGIRGHLDAGLRTLHETLTSREWSTSDVNVEQVQVAADR